jgi:DNA-3-methyladenine glycosylase I
MKEIPSSKPLATQISKIPVKRGFSFVVPTIAYAFMQASGCVNDHLVSCFRHDIV